MRKLLWIPVCLMLACALLVRVQGQPERVYEPLRITPEYRAALNAVHEQKYERAAQLFLEVGQANPGTTLGAQALFNAAFFGPREDRRALYESIIAGYPRSRFEVTARYYIINGQFDYNHIPDQVAAMDALLQSYGAPTLQEITRGDDRAKLVRRVHSLPVELQIGLAEVCADLTTILSARLGRHEDALSLALFNREAFSALDEVTGRSLYGDVAFELMVINFGEQGTHYSPQPRVDPTVRIQSPRQGQSRGPRPRIRVETSVGDYRYPQVDLGRLELRLDGQDLKPYLEVRSKVDRKLREGRPMERLRLEARPPGRLAPGQHTVELVVPTGGYQGTGPGIARLSWTFRVAGDRDDPEDECDDWGDEDRWERDED